MTYEVISISSGIFDPQTIKDITIFCEHIKNQQNFNSADVNMLPDNWENNPASLLNVLLIEKRFSNQNGVFNLLYQNSKIIAVSGAYISDFDRRVVIGGVRTYTLQDYRNDFLHGRYLLPKQIEWAKSKNAEIFCLSFNEYNRWLANFILRCANGKGAVLGKTVPESYLGFIEHPKIVNIKNTKQFLLKKYLVNNSIVDFKEVEV